jgi:ankyrin repeat protein
VDTYTNIPCTTQKIIFTEYKDEYYSKIKIPFGCKIYYEENREITLLYACRKGFVKTATQIILNNEVDDAGAVDSTDCTALIWACRRRMRDLVLLLVDTFGDKCNPQHVGFNGYTALMHACSVDMKLIASSLIHTFGEKCNPGQVGNDGNTALILSCKSTNNEIALLLIKTFREKCKPQSVDNRLFTAILYSISSNMHDVTTSLRAISITF